MRREKIPTPGSLKQFVPALFLILMASATLAHAGNQRQTLTNEKIEAVLRQFVLERAGWKPENLEVRIVPLQPVTVPSGQLNFRVLKPSQSLAPGLHSFLVAVDVAGKEEARLWLKTEIRVFDDVVVSTVPLGHREVVAVKDVRVARRDISALSAKPFLRIDDVVGRQAVRAIEANEILTQKALERPTLMKRGSSVTLVYETGSLRIETPGTAEEGGRVGDFIQVKNASSGKVLRGLVVDGRIVKVN